MLPFDPRVPFDRGAFEARLVVRNIRKESVDGYSFAAGVEPKRAPAEVNHPGDTVALRGLEEGTYYLSARARYFRVEDGVKKYYWTPASGVSFEVGARRDLSPVMAYAEDIQKRLYRHWVAVSVSLATLALSLVTIGYGTRIGFAANLLRFRTLRLWRLLFRDR